MDLSCFSFVSSSEFQTVEQQRTEVELSGRHLLERFSLLLLASQESNFAVGVLYLPLLYSLDTSVLSRRMLQSGEGGDICNGVV